MKEKITKPYFSHDYNPRSDKKILKLIVSMGIEGYGLYWLIVEYMHQNEFAVEDENLLAYDFRCAPEKIHKIMNDFDLFRIENGFYTSDRIQRNLNYVEKKSEDKKQAADTRWLLAAFNKAYTEFFNEEPVLLTEEIEALKQYQKKIPNLKEKLRDIIYTMKFIKFDTKFEFKQRANWLLAKNNLARILNGEFGKLQHKKTEKELKEERQKQTKTEYSELEVQIQSITNKDEALALIVSFYKGSNFAKDRTGKIYMVPEFRKLMSKFEITDEEVIEKCEK